MKSIAKAGLVLVVLLVLGFFFVKRFFNSNTSPKSVAPHLSASLTAGKTESSSSMVSSSSSSASGDAVCPMRRVVFVNASKHPLSQRVADLLEKQLKEFAPIEHFEIEQPAKVFLEGAEAPDLFIRLDMPKIEESGIVSRELKATLTASIGSAPWESHHYVRDFTTPPVVQHHWEGTLEHTSTSSGIHTDRYATIAQNIANQIAKGITNQLDSLRENYPEMPVLPREFFGPYQAVADLDFLKEANAQRVYSHYGLFTHNETFWRFSVAENPVAHLQQLIEKAKAAQWKVYDSTLTNTIEYHASFRNGDGAKLEIFTLGNQSKARNEADKKSVEFVAHYRKPFSRPELESAVEKLFATQSSLETLVPFQDLFTGKQREKFYALIEKSPFASPRAYVQLAEKQLSAKNTNNAIDMLVRARAMKAALRDSTGLQTDIDALAKKISPKEKLKLIPTAETYRQLGFIEITNDQSAFEIEREFGQPLLFFVNDTNRLHTASFTVSAPKNGNYPWTMYQTQEGASSSTTSSFRLPKNGSSSETFTIGQRRLKIAAQPTPDGKQMKLEVKSGEL